jgi:hypothetical protein
VSTRMQTTWGMLDAVEFERDVSNGTGRVETAPAIVMTNPHSFAYLRARKEKLGHTQTLHVECPS